MGIIEKMRLDGKKGFVTGAARGIGKSTAAAFAEAGADVAIVDLDIEEAEKTAAELAEKTGRKVIAIRTDCTDPEQVDAMVVQVVQELGGLDFCHNNAGICINAPAEEMTYQQWSKVININLNGIFLTDIAAGKYMLAHGGGSIINTASMSAHIVNVPQPQCAYNASKAAGRAGKQHQPGIHRNRTDAQFPDTDPSDRNVERDGAPGKTGKTGRTAVDLRIPGRRHQLIHNRI